MPVFVYFVASSTTEPLANLGGIYGATVDRAEIQNLAVFYSELSALPGDATALAQVALQFFKVQEAAFSSASIVPFRFPSSFAGRADLESFINEQAGALNAGLRRISGKSQFDIRISSIRQTSAEVSGVEYLRARAFQSSSLNKLENMCRDQLRDIASEWLSTQEPERTVLHVLVPREAEQEVARRFRSMPAPTEASLVVLGPWPPGAFVNLAAVVGQ